MVRSLGGTGLYARGTVNEKECLWVVDTGSSVTVVRPDFSEPCVRTDLALSLRTATGETTPVLGEAAMQIAVTGLIDGSPHRIIVADIEDEGILGLDVLAVYDCVISTGGGSLRSGNREIALLRTGSGTCWSPRRSEK